MSTKIADPGLESNLVRSVLDIVSLRTVLDVVTDYVRTANRADQMLAALTLRGERAKPLIESRSGPSWSTEQAGKALKKSAETIRAYVANGKLIGYSAVGDRTRVRLPVWQFRAGGGQSGVHEWVPELLSAFGANGWGLLDFVTVPRNHLDGSHYLHLLQGGRADEVIAAARRSNPD